MIGQDVGPSSTAARHALLRYTFFSAVNTA